MPPLERFWSKVQKGDGCWLWLGSLVQHGYGVFAHSATWSERAHRVAWRLAHGVEVLPAGQMIRHSCDNRACVNPAHLSIGTHKDNMRDMAERGRALLGSRHPKAKLNEVQVAEIRARLEMGANRADLAREFGVSWDLIDRIKRGIVWKHVKRADP